MPREVLVVPADPAWVDIQNCRIASTWIGMEDHGLFTVNINFEGDGWGQGTGHRIYGCPSSDKGAQFDAGLGRYLASIFDAVGVDTWEQLKGCKVRVARQERFQDIVAIGNWMKNEWAPTRSKTGVPAPDATDLVHEAAKTLRALEWSGWSSTGDSDGISECPSCGVKELLQKIERGGPGEDGIVVRESAGVHAVNCALAAMLRRLEGSSA